MKKQDSDFFHRSALHRSAPTEIDLGVTRTPLGSVEFQARCWIETFGLMGNSEGSL